MSNAMTQLVMQVDDYIGRNKRWIGLTLLAGAFVAALVGAWGVTIREVVGAAPLP